MIAKLNIFELSEPEIKNPFIECLNYVSEENSQDVLALSENVKIEINEELTIVSKIIESSLACSVSLKSNDVHVFTVLASRKTLDDTSPTLLYTSKSGKDYQITIETS